MPKITCKRCNHTWQSLVDKPVVCPRCKSYDYDKPRKREQTTQNWVVGDTPEACIPLGEQTAQDHGLPVGVKVMRARSAEEAVKIGDKQTKKEEGK